MEKMRAYKYRFYPTEEQTNILNRTFGCVRYVYNWGLHLKDVAYHDKGERLYYKAFLVNSHS
ncbi:helix-turn-helix domain-containing protein [Alicyclobacillus fodiniaquatilis]|uniref:Helix-turn-helix domain-containing protein n=1 Tax=Alicyclobacillus fodiniaquatilis TaxID=1661150 RepID=A0ABW4JHU6_9BACL